MQPTRRARAPPVVGIVGAPGHCPAAAAPHRIPEGTALGDHSLVTYGEIEDRAKMTYSILDLIKRGLRAKTLSAKLHTDWTGAQFYSI